MASRPPGSLSKYDINVWLAALRRAGCNPKVEGSGYRASCPTAAHENGNRRNPALSITTGANGTVLVYCHAKNCSFEAIWAALDLGPELNMASPSPSALGRPPLWRPEPPPGSRIYRDASGKPLMAVHRIDRRNGKQFSQWRPQDDGWVAQSLPRPRPLYNLPGLAKPGEVLVVEGEKCADAAAAAWPERPVTAWPGGAKAHGGVDWSPLRDRDVLLLADADEPGRAAMRQIAVRLAAIGCSVRLALPDGDDGSDVSDLLAERSPTDALTRIEGLAQPMASATPDTAPQRNNGTVFPEKDAASLEAALQSLGIDLRYNLRAQRGEMSRDGGRTWIAMTDRSIAALRRDIAERFEYSTTRGPRPLTFGREAWKLSADALFYERECDPFMEWLESLPPWDGESRLSRWLEEAFVLEKGDDLLAAWAGRFVFLGAVQRAYVPGAKLDEVPVLIGRGGIGKSTAVGLALPPDQPEWFTDGLNLAAPPKERIEALQGRVIVEVAEMAGATRADLEGLKSFLSRTQDVVRLAYRENPETLPRRAIIVGTTDHSEPLPNDRNLRRFVPVYLASGNPAGVRRYLDANREQLWAEARRCHQQGMEARLPDELKGAQAQATEQARRRDQILEERVARWLTNRREPCTLAECAVGAGLVQKGVEAQIPRGAEQRLGTALRALGCRKERRQVDGRRRVLWMPLH